MASSGKHSAALVVAILFGTVGLAHAGRFQVNPTTVELAPTSATGAVAVSNHGATRLRVQITAQRWTDDADGVMQLSATTDLVVRPSLVEIPAGESRTIRVGLVGKAGAIEGSYRIFAEELPEPATPGTAQIQVLTRVGVPVFVAPAARVNQLEVGVAFARGAAIVSVTNRGTYRHKLDQIKVRGDDRWHHELVGWYVLPGATRRFTVPLDGDACTGEKSITAELTEGSDHWTSAAVTPPCSDR